MTSGPHTPSSRLTLSALRLYQRADLLSGVVICFMVVFSPWAFGTTQPWSIWTMNTCGYTLGLLLAAKLFIRFGRGYRPARWGDLGTLNTQHRTLTTPHSALRTPHSDLLPRLWLAALAILTVLILTYCLISALNARATYDWSQGSLIYRECVRWLPHSYDAPSTWRVFWNYLALALFFWSLRDWLLGRTAAEARALGGTSVPASRSPSLNPQRSTFNLQLPSRLRWLLWLLSLNGALLAVEGIVQRLSGTNKLLWIMPTRLNKTAAAQFGPYAYRSNGAQYLNLIWPVSLGFWWTLRRQARRERSTESGNRTTAWRHLLLPCILITAAAPIISTSRAGAIVAIGMLLLAGAILLIALRRRHPLTRFFAVLPCAAAVALGAYVGGDPLLERMKEFGPNLELREAIYDSSRSMVKDSPLFGLGPGTFAVLFQFYLPALGDNWLAQLHNDWLETRITFGWIGCALIALVFLLNLARASVAGGLAVRWPLVSLIWLSMAGCLVQARWDFPFQIYSILFLFLLLCGILSSLSLRQAASTSWS